MVGTIIWPTLCAAISIYYVLFDGFPVAADPNQINSEYPYIATLRERKTWRHFCAGSILNPNWIVTATRCFRNYSIFDVYASVGSVVVETGTKYEIKNIFRNSESTSDLALLQTVTQIFFRNPNVNSISLGDYKVEDFSKAKLIGFATISRPVYLGEPNFLQFLEMLIIQRCPFEPGNDGYFCALPSTGPENLCFADYGSPLVQNNQLIGITSEGEEGLCKPTYFIRISHYMVWLLTTLKTVP